MAYSREEIAWLTLWCLKGMTPRRFYNLLTQAGDLSEITEAPDEFRPLFEEDMFRSLKQALDAGIACGYEKALVKKLSALTDAIAEKTAALETAVAALPGGDLIEESAAIRDKVLPAMEELRTFCDEAETLTAKTCWPFPTYAELLFGV